ncbi:PD-(D/E)XK nuclease-like domain-containing protein [Pectobacterium carotovorum]|uniref:PD-(D/E)XK nuclease-like domain-containing protein n=1 Tax=Pectobacterium carotovorum TaxID=554 RepID=UPI003802659A
MTPHAYFVEAYQKSGKKHLFIVLDAKNEARAEREVLNILDDNEIAVGRGADYKNPVRTHYPVFDDLPKDRVIDDTWCDRNMLEDDRLTWKKIPKPESASTNFQDDHADVAGKTASTQLADTAANDGTITIDQASFIQRIGGGWLYESFTELSIVQQREISALQHDMEATYFQNLLLALNNAKELLRAQHCFHETLFGLIDTVKSVWSPDGKAPSVGDIVSFSKEWLDARHENSTLERSGLYRHEVTAKWAKKSSVPRTGSGAIAGDGGNTDRTYTHTLDTLDIEIALFITPFDFDIYNVPGPVFRRAKEIVANKEQPFKTWSQTLRAMPGILSVFKAGIGALIRKANQDVTHFPDSLQRYINSTLTAEYYTTPTQELLALARHTPANPAKQENTETDKELVTQPQVENLGDGKFSIEGLVSDCAATQEERKGPFYIKQPATGRFSELFTLRKFNQLINEGCVEISHEEFLQLQTDFARKNPEVTDEFSAGDTSNVQMEAAGNQSIEAGAAVPTPENDDGSIEEAKAALESSVNKWIGEGAAAAEPVEPAATDEPPYFEPGRYEGVPNNDYHAANGISSTQVKDARISLMYYRGRHITKTIRRDSSDALTFGSLVHTLALEPEKLEEEYAIFPGVPAGAFTNTDTLKAWIREYNADKPKAEQLKLTGKKEELQEAIRAVNPEAIFADEFESQWRTSVSDKIILTVEQLQAATAIQQALFNHPTAGKLLQHPARAVEVSYFGMDDETGLEVRVRPDEELELNGLRIAADVKTISLGKVKQDNLRAKLHREIIDRDYHVSAAMYSEVADFDQFFWIFVNKDEGYHWVAVIEASTDLLELGSLEYHRTMRELANAYDTDTWPAPVTADYTDELNDFDQRRLEALRMA